ncbi:unnamed protein product, partial [Amoebophrya sp. A120]
LASSTVGSYGEHYNMSRSARAPTEAGELEQAYRQRPPSFCSPGARFENDRSPPGAAEQVGRASAGDRSYFA